MSDMNGDPLGFKDVYDIYEAKEQHKKHQQELREAYERGLADATKVSQMSFEECMSEYVHDGGTNVYPNEDENPSFEVTLNQLKQIWEAAPRSIKLAKIVLPSAQELSDYAWEIAEINQDALSIERSQKIIEWLREQIKRLNAGATFKIEGANE